MNEGPPDSSLTPKNDPNTTPAGVPGENGGTGTNGPTTGPGEGPASQTPDATGFLPSEPVPPPQEDTNPKAQRVDGTNYVDESTASALAYPTKDFRGKASDNRAITRQWEDKADDMTGRVLDLARQEPSRLRIFKHADHQGRLKGLEDEYDGFTDEIARADLAAEAQAIKDLPELQEAIEREEEALGNHGRAINRLYPTDPEFGWSPEERAETYDRRADRIEEWAGALHEHPLSAAFKKAHPGMQFQPKALVRLEDDIAGMERGVEEYESPRTREITSAIGMIIESRGTVGSARVVEIERMLRFADRSMYERWDEITANVKQAASPADDFYEELFEAEKTQPLRERLAMTRNTLNDVRREVGLPVEGDEAAAEAPEQPTETGSQAEASDQPPQETGSQTEVPPGPPTI